MRKVVFLPTLSSLSIHFFQIGQHHVAGCWALTAFSCPISSLLCWDLTESVWHSGLKQTPRVRTLLHFFNGSCSLSIQKTQMFEPSHSFNEVALWSSLIQYIYFSNSLYLLRSSNLIFSKGVIIFSAVESIDLSPLHLILCMALYDVRFKCRWLGWKNSSTKFSMHCSQAVLKTAKDSKLCSDWLRKSETSVHLCMRCHHWVYVVWHFDFPIIPLTADFGIFSCLKMSWLNLLHRLHLFTESCWNSLPFFPHRYGAMSRCQERDMNTWN